MAAEKRFNVEAWEPKTQVGKMVKEGTITDMDYILDNGLPLLEPEIVDALLPDITEQVLDVSLVQRMHKSGRRARFRATVAVGNKNGYVGVGMGKAKEVGPAIRKAIAHAKLSLIRIRLGCGSWECGCGAPHSIPFTAKGSCASVKIELLPAPRGVGLVAGDVAKAVLGLAGIKDIWTKTFGDTRTTYNFAMATFDALKNLNFVRYLPEHKETLGINEGKVL
ncbi:30S ribosomal protein S5 [Methanothermococcus okinawensis]|uniref:Small ribosomal subunit protein uS5 n=1 Tax=Methanothermococcus okinawensis (strain DSM 14208 / JCM 11175 / IH1) TaxID=647113 RepID=F8AL96_METOI|nr:30S ribosomal protein S5 [Methanothermococcus okinawensis]AEH06763.1 ribosomal protein S5 [Methanothermococcus okinawensis IH1]